MATSRHDLVRLHFKLVTAALAAGGIGGIVNFLIVPLFGALHITTALGVNIHPELHKEDLYHQYFWGALWGLVLMAPLHKYIPNWWLRASIFGIFPALVQLFVVFPSHGQQPGGLRLGALTPAFVLLFNTLGWSIPAYAWFCTAVTSGAEGPHLYLSLFDGA